MRTEQGSWMRRCRFCFVTSKRDGEGLFRGLPGWVCGGVWSLLC